MVTPSLPQTGATPLFMASQNGHREVVEILIRSRADINLPRDVRMSFDACARHFRL